MTYYKVLNEHGTPHHGGRGQWHLPKNGKPGRWMRRIANPEACVRGYHACTAKQLPQWLGPAIYELEFREPPYDAGDKVVGSQARLLRRFDTWNEQTARLCAADCAEHVLPTFERARPHDARVRETIKTSRAFGFGLANPDQLAAAREAASAAARDAAREAAWVAVSDAASSTAWAAARDAACAAAWVAASDAASEAPSGAAWEAARAAACAAAWAAPSGAAWEAERIWQVERLFAYLNGTVDLDAIRESLA